MVQAHLEAQKRVTSNTCDSFCLSTFYPTLHSPFPFTNTTSGNNQRKQYQKRGCVISLDNSWCITVGYRMHNRCCACAYQLLCKRTTAVVRPEILTVSTTYPISSNNLFYLFQQHILSLSASYPISFSDITHIYQRQEEGES